MANSSKRSGGKSRVKTSHILDASISGTLTLQVSNLQSNNTASKRLHCPLIMVTASKTSKSPLHSAFQSPENSPTKYGHYQFRTTASNDHPTLWTGWRVSLRCSTTTPQPRRKRLLILAWHRIVEWPCFWTLVWPNFHLWQPFKNPHRQPDYCQQIPKHLPGKPDKCPSAPLKHTLSHQRNIHHL